MSGGCYSLHKYFSDLVLEGISTLKITQNTSDLQIAPKGRGKWQ
jgi:hypothetical protein